MLVGLGLEGDAYGLECAVLHNEPRRGYFDQMKGQRAAQRSPCTYVVTPPNGTVGTA